MVIVFVPKTWGCFCSPSIHGLNSWRYKWGVRSTYIFTTIHWDDPILQLKSPEKSVSTCNNESLQKRKFQAIAGHVLAHTSGAEIATKSRWGSDDELHPVVKITEPNCDVKEQRARMKYFHHSMIFHGSSIAGFDGKGYFQNPTIFLFSYFGLIMALLFQEWPLFKAAERLQKPGFQAPFSGTKNHQDDMFITFLLGQTTHRFICHEPASWRGGVQ